MVWHLEPVGAMISTVRVLVEVRPDCASDVGHDRRAGRHGKNQFRNVARSRIWTNLFGPGVSPWVVLAAPSLNECHIKLFRTHHEGHGATEGAKRLDVSRTLDGSLRLEMCDLLCKLLAAFRAFEWPKVLVLLHEAFSGNGSLLCNVCRGSS